MARAHSLTHELVVERSLTMGGWLDAEIDDSFPASDPLSHWAGPRRRESEADRAHGRIVERDPVEEASEQQHPEEPRPGRLVR